MTETVLPFDLALVIPVWNDAWGLARLLAQVRDGGLFAQVIVVDDGSDRPVQAADVTLIRHATPQGAGPARNAGLAAVTAEHVLFFDADDALTDDLAPLLADLAGAGQFDLCLFDHADSRVLAEGRWGQTDWDLRIWAEAGCARGAMQEAVDLPLLAQTTNYPWNKIYRTDFLRDNGIACGTTRLHEDMPLHWGGFVLAERALVSDRVCALHHVAEGAGRQTNLMGAERLEVFAALDPVARRVADAGPEWQAAFVRYVIVLLDWVARRIAPGHLGALQQAERDWLSEAVLPWLDEIAKTDSVTAQNLQDRLA